MKVKELIELLSKVDAEVEIIFSKQGERFGYRLKEIETPNECTVETVGQNFVIIRPIESE